MGYYWNVIAVWPITQNITENIDFEIGAQTFLCDFAKTVKTFHQRITAHLQCDSTCKIWFKFHALLMHFFIKTLQM